MRSRALRRYLAEKISMKRWKHFHCFRTEFSHGVFPPLSFPWFWNEPIGRYRKWNGNCSHRKRCRRKDEKREDDAKKTDFAAFRSRLIR